MKIVVVGGGTAGWLSALYAQKFIPYADVTVIASKEIGILGAGESTTNTFIDLLNLLDIPVVDIYKHAKGTVKLATKFMNWHGDGTSYIFGFNDMLPSILGNNDKTIDLVHLRMAADGKNADELQLTHFLAKENKIKCNKNTNETYGDYAVCFDARKLAFYLQTVAMNRGVKLIDDKVIKINNGQNDFIESFDLASEINVPADFVFDCTGFNRLIIGKHYGSVWNSYKKHLPVDRAIPFFIDMKENEEIPPYVQAIAMKYGWMWKIPVQGRYGSGYVFDSSFATDEQIIEELTEYLGYTPKIPTKFSFTAGSYEKVWIKNCLAVGLSAGFVEPLESTSLYVSSCILRSFISSPSDIFEKLTSIDESKKEYFNKIIKKINDDVLNFIYLHYVTNRNDTEFWKNFRKNNPEPKFFSIFDEFCKSTFPKEHDFKYLHQLDFREEAFTPFRPSNYYIVGLGVNFFDKEVARHELEYYKEDINYKKRHTGDVIETYKSIVSECYSHKEYIELLINNG